jgi:hypothetical protein
MIDGMSGSRMSRESEQGVSRGVTLSADDEGTIDNSGCRRRIG